MIKNLPQMSRTDFSSTASQARLARGVAERRRPDRLRVRVHSTVEHRHRVRLRARFPPDAARVRREEDRNGARNADETPSTSPARANDWIVGDNGVAGGLADGDEFVILGDQNSDAVDGDSVEGVIQQRSISTAFRIRCPRATARAKRRRRRASSRPSTRATRHSARPTSPTTRLATSAPTTSCHRTDSTCSARPCSGRPPTIRCPRSPVNSHSRVPTTDSCGWT